MRMKWSECLVYTRKLWRLQQPFFPLLYASTTLWPPSGGRADLQLFMLAKKTSKQKTHKDNSFSCFNNLQHYSNYLTCHSNVNIIWCQLVCHYVVPLLGMQGGRQKALFIFQWLVATICNFSSILKGGRQFLYKAGNEAVHCWRNSSLHEAKWIITTKYEHWHTCCPSQFLTQFLTWVRLSDPESVPQTTSVDVTQLTRTSHRES